MTLAAWILRVALMWFGLALPVGAVIGRCIGRGEQPTPEPRMWTDEAVRAEFDALVPSFVTAEVFALDNQLNRKARGGAW